MKRSSRILAILFALLFVTGCVSSSRNYEIAVNNLDPLGFRHDTVGNFEVYTGSFQVINPSNSSFTNVDVVISVAPTAAYCHGLTKSFSIPRISPNEKKTVQLSIAEFGDLDCQYNYTYQVFTQTEV